MLRAEVRPSLQTSDELWKQKQTEVKTEHDNIQSVMRLRTAVSHHGLRMRESDPKLCMSVSGWRYIRAPAARSRPWQTHSVCHCAPWAFYIRRRAAGADWGLCPSPRPAADRRRFCASAVWARLLTPSCFMNKMGAKQEAAMLLVQMEGVRQSERKTQGKTEREREN